MKLLILGIFLIASNLFAGSKCREPKLGYKIGQNVYAQKDTYSPFKYAKIVALRCNGNYVVRFEDGSSRDEEKQYATNINETSFYQLDACTSLTENGVEVCTNETVLNLSSAQEIQIIAYNPTHSIILYSSNGIVTKLNTAYIISLQEYYDFNSGE